MHIHICIYIHAHTLQGHNRPHAASNKPNYHAHTCYPYKHTYTYIYSYIYIHIYICITHTHTLHGHTLPCRPCHHPAAYIPTPYTLHNTRWTYTTQCTHSAPSHTHCTNEYTHCTHITSMQPTTITSHKNRALYRALMPYTSHHNHNPALLLSKLTCNTITNKNSRHTIIKPLPKLNT